MLLLKSSLLLIILNSISSYPDKSPVTSFPSNFVPYAPIEKSFSPDVINYFSMFASIGYCSQEEIITNRCCNSFITENGWTLLDSGLDPKNKKYNYAIFINDEYKKIVITVPGTRNTKELISEIGQSLLVPFDPTTEMRVVKYFKDRAFSIKDQLFSDKNKNIINSNKNYQIIFTGHSLGGAVATILSLYSIKSSFINPSHNEPILITFGQPRSGNDVFANEVMKHIPKIFRIVRQGDIVPTIPSCVKSIFGSCKTIFADGIFDYTYELKERSIFKEFFRVNVNYWHIGGLVILDKEMNEYSICEYNRGENHIGDCDNKQSLDFTMHTYYVNKDVSISERCSSYS